MTSEYPSRSVRKSRHADDTDTPEQIRRYLFNSEPPTRTNTRTRNQHAYGQSAHESNSRANGSYPRSRSSQETIESLAAANQESLDNTIHTLHKAQDVSGSTMQMLQQQSEQLERIDRDLSSVNNSLALSGRVLKGMESIGGSISNWWKGPPPSKDLTFNQNAAREAQRVQEEEDARRAKAERRKKERGWFSWLRSGSDSDSEDDSAQKKNKDTKRGYDPALADFYARAGDRDTTDRSTATQGRSGSSSTSGSQRAGGRDEEEAQVLAMAMRAREAEDEKLDQVGSLLDMLKRDAREMGKELQVQNAHLQHISAGVDKSQGQIKEQSRRMDKMR